MKITLTITFNVQRVSGKMLSRSELGYSLAQHLRTLPSQIEVGGSLFRIEEFGVVAPHGYDSRPSSNGKEGSGDAC